MRAADSSGDPFSIGSIIDGRYEITAKLGVGGMGAVYRATQRVIGRDVAIKVLRKELAVQEKAVRRFHREAQAVSATHHPNVVTVHDFGQLEDATLYLVLEYIDGEDLARALARVGLMDAGRAVNIICQVLDALEGAHAAGVVHRDLKPENILLSQHAGKADFVKVLDFGLARVEEAVTITGSGEVFGTPVYISPEQAKGQRADGRADLYAVGIILYELLTGRPPFRGSSSMALLMQHMRDPPPAFETSAPGVRIHPKIQAVVYAALDKDPQRRPPSPGVMRDQLQAALAAHESVAPAPVDLTLRDPAFELGGRPTAEAETHVSLPAPELQVVPPLEARAPRHETRPPPEPSEDLRVPRWYDDRRRVVALAAVVGALVMTLGWAMFGGSGSDAPEVSAAPTPKPLAAAAPAPTERAPPAAKPPPDAGVVAVPEAPPTHAVTLRTEPAGARVKVAVRSPGAQASLIHRFPETPASLDVPAGAEVDVSFQLEGYLPARIGWRSEGDREVVQALAPRVRRARPRAERRPRGDRSPPPAPVKEDPEEELDDLK